MSDAWKNIQALKNKRKRIREKLQKRKSARHNILRRPIAGYSESKPEVEIYEESAVEIERLLLEELSSVMLTFPISSRQLLSLIKTKMNSLISHVTVCNLLQKFSLQELVSTRDCSKDEENVVEVLSAEQTKLAAMATELNCSPTDAVHSECKVKEENKYNLVENTSHVKCSKSNNAGRKTKENKSTPSTEVLSLISTPSIREKETKKIGEEILDLLSKPTTKERALTELFRSQGGTQVMEFCAHRTRQECTLAGDENCKKLHFKRIIASHTEESLGDCSYLNTCFHMDTCKYVHYQVDKIPEDLTKKDNKPPTEFSLIKASSSLDNSGLYPPQWVQCDLRFFDTSIFGKFAVIMADPPWDIHMELPYGTLSDDEMRQLGIPKLQDEGLLFLWVTGRAMELGRECLALWGYEYIDELVWVKTNQLQRIIRTGRTGHWLNHGKEHCLVGMKGNPKNLNRGLDCDVIVSEVRDTSHKPDEIYGIIERLSPGTRKIELFGRAHNVQPNWITIGNQVEGIQLVDPAIIKMYKKRYPDGYNLSGQN